MTHLEATASVYETLVLRCPSCFHLVHVSEVSECSQCGDWFCGKAANHCKASCSCDREAIAVLTKGAAFGQA